MTQPATNSAPAMTPAPLDFSEFGATPVPATRASVPAAPKAKPPLDFSEFGATPIPTPPKGVKEDFSEFGEVPQGYNGPLTSTGIAAPQGASTKAQAWQATKQGAKDLLTGASEGAANTVGSSIVGTAKLLNKIPFLGKYLAPQEGVDALSNLTTSRSAPENTTQAIGKGAEQVGEFLLPGAGEEDAVAHAAPYLTKLGKFANPLARILYQAGTTGLVNAAQGGSPLTGAAAGAAGGAVGEGLRAVAPAVAESALGITKRLRGYGKTPGLAALEETTGLSPATIEKQAQQKLGQLTDQIENTASAKSGYAPQPRPAAPLQPQTPVSLNPALNVIDDEISKATAQNNGQAIEQLNRVRDALTTGATTGVPIAADQTPTGALNLKRGLRNQFVKNWNPELMSGTRAVAARASGAIDNELDNALGSDFTSANQRISSLVPVAERAESLERDPGIAQRVGNRVAAHTGALALSGLSGAEGYRERGLPGAITGGLVGLVLPELLTSAPGRMAAARIMYKPGALLRLLNGAGLQLDRSGEGAQ